MLEVLIESNLKASPASAEKMIALTLPRVLPLHDDEVYYLANTEHKAGYSLVKNFSRSLIYRSIRVHTV